MYNAQQNANRKQSPVDVEITSLRRSTLIITHGLELGI
jgi:hypothetical protein